MRESELMNKVSKLYQDEGINQSNTYLYGCQHILRPREIMLDILVRAGIPKSHIHLFGKYYSTNYRLLQELKDKGYDVKQPKPKTNEDFDNQHRANCEEIIQSIISDVPNGSRIIVLDDGGMLLYTLKNRFVEIDNTNKVIGIEQTSSGFRKLENLELSFPVINVARSVVKLDKESPFIAEICLKKIFEYFSKKGLIPDRYMVIGQGPVGKSISKVLKSKNMAVRSLDIKQGYEIEKELLSFRPEVIIGATGTKAISLNDISLLNEQKSPIYLISVSSSDREFPVSNFRQKKDLETHADVAYKNITFVSNGFPINFQDSYYKDGVMKIEKTICLLLGAVLFAAGTNGNRMKKGLVPVASEIEEALT